MPATPPPGCFQAFVGASDPLSPWETYRLVLGYLRDSTRPETFVANVLNRYPMESLNGPVGRLSPFLAESGICWLQWVNIDLDHEFAGQLEATADSVVVWDPRQGNVIPAMKLEHVVAIIRRDYEPEARFGHVEVWRRKPLDRGSTRSPVPVARRAPPIRPHTNRSAVRNRGNSQAQTAVTAIAPSPPNATAPTGPRTRAVTPLSNSPSSFDAPMNSVATADTRPRIRSGVAICTRLCRVNTDTMSAPPSTARANTDSGNRSRVGEHHGHQPEQADGQEHLHARARADRPVGQIRGHHQGPDRRGCAQDAEPLRADREHVAGEHREQAGRAAEQHGEQVERDRPEHQFVSPEVHEPFPDLGDPRPGRLDRRPGVGTDQQGAGRRRRRRARH